MEPSLGELVQWAANEMRRRTNTDEVHLVPELVARGADEELAAEIIRFVPLAFGRFAFKDSGARFQPTYWRVDYATRSRPGYRLDDEPVYSEAWKLAQAWFEGGIGGQEYLAVAGRSPEVRAINEALANGSKPENLLFSEPVVWGLKPKPQKRAWWCFWRRNA